MKQFAIYGASGFGREILPVLRRQLQDAEADPWDLVFIDDMPAATFQNGHRVLTYSQWLNESTGSKHISLAVADSSIRKSLALRCQSDGMAFQQIRAESAVVMDDVQIGEGAILCPFVTLTSNVRIGRHFHANLYSYVAHDCVIGDFVTFAPGVHCNGNIIVEDHAYIGTGAILRQGHADSPLIIGHGAVVGMGAVVTKSVPPGVTVVGNPARVLKR
ncbi:acetyltransferase [Ralstonia holmesii]|uniref:acetyltransferase n=1 Tax=Ralstonia TaxID=48736 RepID=UPI00046A62A4|nr:acetyltransferase [Ralstonia pickettii]